MALDTKIRIKRNPYHGFEVWVWGDGKLTRRTFADSIDLSAKLLAEKYDKHIAEAACDMLDELEWQEPEYPLGVAYVGEAVCDFAPPDYDPQTVAFDQSDRHRELIEELRRTNDRLWFRSEGFKVMLGVSFAVIALLIWRVW